jgi:hypothetical protein
MMNTAAQKPATTPIPVQLSETEFTGPCPCTLRINTTGVPVDRHRGKKAEP